MTTLSSAQINPEVDLNNLSEVQLAVLKKLGIDGRSLEKLKKRAEASVKKEAKKVGVTISSEYHLVTSRKCSLCGNVEIQAFHMTKTFCPGGTPCLKSENIKLEEVGGNGFKTAKQEYISLSCGMCEERLMQLNPREVVRMLIKAQNKPVKNAR